MSVPGGGQEKCVCPKGNSEESVSVPVGGQEKCVCPRESSERSVCLSRGVMRARCVSVPRGGDES